MRTHVFPGVLAGFLFANFAAVAGTIVVSPDGSNAGACGTNAAPCQTLQRGITRVDPGGTVILRDPGNYGGAIIDKSLTIIGAPGAGTFSPGAVPCLTINGAANDTVTLRGFNCNMDGAASDGILYNSGHKFQGDNIFVQGATGAKCGIRVKPSSGNDELPIHNSTISGNGTTGTNDGGGICILPTGTAHVSSIIRNSVFENNRHGLVSAPSGSATSSLLIDNVDLSNNVGGLFSVGGNSTACIRRSTLTGNSFQGVGGGGVLLDGGDNLIFNNATNGTLPGNCP